MYIGAEHNIIAIILLRKGELAASLLSYSCCLCFAPLSREAKGWSVACGCRTHVLFFVVVLFLNC